MRMHEFEDGWQCSMGPDAIDAVSSVTVMAGCDKCGAAEAVSELNVCAGETVCLLGKTGAGKSRLLDDISVLAQGDTPSKRRVLINGMQLAEEQRYGLSSTLVAQLSQNMHFVTDLTVCGFLVMHAQSRLSERPEQLAADVLECANELAGEAFLPDTPLTSLSGGQSRALMVADVALLSSSPIVLLDEIENAGIDKHKALSLLAQNQKITLISTHDPVLALMGTRRVIISNGGMSSVLETTDEEQRNLQFLLGVDAHLDHVRACLRSGKRLQEDLKNVFAVRECVGDAAFRPF